jgi:hypothetical protein
MYVRVSRFEGGTATDIDTEVARLRGDVEASRRGELGSATPSELIQVASRLEMLVDREHGSVAVCVYCDTQEKLREANRILNSMSPATPGWGTRVSVDTYEVAFDEAVNPPKAL